VRKEVKLLLCLVVLGAVGFASASIVNGANALSSGTTTTGTTATPPPSTQTVTVTTSNTVTQRVVVIRPVYVALCHRTPAGRFLTIHLRVGVGALASHIKRGDATGRCTVAKIRAMKKQLRHKRG
jgi:hypothetical protein